MAVEGSGGARTGPLAWASRALREPLLQFVLIGAVLFGADRLLNGAPPPAAGDAIEISQGRVRQLAAGWQAIAGRTPTRAELQGLVDDFVTEEIGYREALAMGLDADDTVVRRRMRQKLEFLVEDGAASSEPDDDTLRRWLSAHAADYRVPERRAVRQVLLARDRRGERAGTDAPSLLARLRAGADPSALGDPSMLPAVSPPTTRAGYAGTFGEAFASEVFAHAGSGWFGPVASPFGAHLVLVMSVEPARDGDFDTLRDRLQSDWIEAQRGAARDAQQARLRQRYRVRIDWPPGYGDMPKQPDPAPKTRSLRGEAVEE